MARNKEFKSRPPPLSHVSMATLQPHSVNGALPFFNPTRARYHLIPASGSIQDSDPEDSSVPDDNGVKAQYQWRSRDNRKGRHPLVVDKGSKQKGGPASTTSFRAILTGLKRMATECPYWDVSYLVAVFFTVGCAIFIACGLFYWLPLVDPSSEFDGETKYAGGITAFIGATLFQVGAVLLVFEACNEHQTGCFGWVLGQTLGVNREASRRSGVNDTSDEGAAGLILLTIKAHPDGCAHPHRQHPREERPRPQEGRRWEWWPSYDEIKTHYIHEMGWVASMTMALGATIFYVSGICALPGIYSNMSQGLAYGLYWMTYLVGGVFFILSSVLYILETQLNWYTPAPRLLGWHIGPWNLIGSIGWTLVASLGYCKASWCE